MLATINRLATLLTITSLLGVVALYLYTLPALRRLPKDKEQSLNGITTMDDAVRYLRTTSAVSRAGQSIVEVIGYLVLRVAAWL